ncbi:MAG: hypothetical protein WBP02_12335 [Gammaproteobacteria bacterium]
MMNFINTTLLGGLLILLPLMLLWLGLQEIAGLLIAMATPIADLFPKGPFEDLAAPGLVAVLLIVAVSFILGLAARSYLLIRIGRQIENSILEKLPMYRMLKVMSGALLDADTSGVVPALIKDDAGGGDPCYVIEKHKDGRATVLLPWSPASFAGSIKVVQQSSLEIVPCSLDEFSRSISQVGVGIEDCLTALPSDSA